MEKIYGKPDIVCIAFPAWEGEYAKSTVQLMGLLCLEHKTLYVEYEYSWLDVLMGLLRKKAVPFKRVIGLQNRLRKIKAPSGGEVFVLTPPATFPINWIDNHHIYRVALRANNWWVRRSIRRAMGKLGIKNPVIVNAFNPFYGLYNLKKFDEVLSVYYCYDEIGSSVWAGKHGKPIEYDYISQVDVVITTSESLLQARKGVNKRCYLVKNGVDFDLFNKAVAGPRPTGPSSVGYIGSIDERLDYDLLAYIIKENPSLNFKFVGRTVLPEKAKALQQYPNVVLTGPLPYSSLPEEIAQMDICLIPFVKNDFTKNIYPLKINEYLAAGKPVVMTDFAKLDEFAGTVQVCGDKISFSLALQDGLAADSPAKRKARQAVARQNSWQGRAKEFSSIISMAH